MDSILRGTRSETPKGLGDQCAYLPLCIVHVHKRNDEVVSEHNRSKNQKNYISSKILSLNYL